MNGADIFKASAELRQLRDLGLIVPKGRGRATYYIPNDWQLQSSNILSGNPTPLSGNPIFAIPDTLKEKIDKIGKRILDKEQLNIIICELCEWKAFSIKQLAIILGRNEKYLLENYVIPLREAGRLSYTIPDMPNHPDQAYQKSGQAT